MTPVMTLRHRAAREEALLLRIEAGYRPRPSWRDHRNCAGQDPNLWYSGTREGPTICEACPVRCDCLANTIAIEQNLPSSDYAVGHIAVSVRARRLYLDRHHPRTPTIEHGTARGYATHLRHRIPIVGCDCRAANAAAKAAAKAARRTQVA